MLSSLLTVATLAASLSTVSSLPRAGPSAFESNQAYRSPSLTVPELQLDISAVYEGLGKRWTDTYQGELKFPYGVASGDP